MPDIPKLYETYAANTARYPALYTELATQLGVSAEAVAKAEIGFIPVDEHGNQAWASPERTAKGVVVGVQKRLDSGKKYAVPGSKRGLAYMVDHDTTQYERNDGWERVSAEYPCPLCGHPDGCMYPKGEYDNPNAVTCVTTKVGSTKPSGTGWLHVFDAARQKALTRHYSILLPSEHPVLIVEGWSDVLAAYDLGFVAVGKPSGSSKKTAKDLTNLLTDRAVVVMGENDAGAGKGGMESTFEDLRGTCKDLTKMMPPTGVKDLRQWVEKGLTKDELLGYITKHGDQAPLDIDALTDIDVAEQFVREHRDKVRYNCDRGQWMNYDGQRWSYKTGKAVVIRCYIQTTKQMFKDAINCKDPDERKRLKTCAQRAQSATGRRGALSYVEALEPITSLQADYDQDDFLLNVADCTIDLRTGEPQPHNPNDMITLLAPVNYYYTGRPTPAALWFAGLNRWHPDDEDTLDYLQRLTGMCCTGDITSRVFPIFEGDGSNGKNVFLDTLRGMLGDYAGKAARKLLIATRNDEHPTEIADLAGKRLVTSSETKKGDKLRVELVKALTGDETEKARFMRKDYFEFKQTASHLMITNWSLGVDWADKAAWNRLHLLLWKVEIPEAEWDTKYTAKLREEWTGILRWAIKGCLKWQEDGRLIPTESIIRDTQKYRNSQNPMPEFAQHCTESGSEVAVDELYQVWRCWCDRDGSKPGKRGSFIHDLLTVLDDVRVEDNDAGEQVVTGIEMTAYATTILGQG
ncbi:MAG: hypothetical protein GY938_30640 [Ketobacter sp.]|nr:hypothetical protein [Ketobacter sp.]